MSIEYGKEREDVRIYQHLLAPGPQSSLMTRYYAVTHTVESDPWGLFKCIKTELNIDALLAATIIIIIITIIIILFI